MLVKVKDDATDFPSYTTNATALIDSCFSKYESIELLTDGLRVGEKTSNAGTVFCYTGVLNRFFFISKGKTAQWSAHAPFYEMYEEFSPTTTATGDEITDFFSEMKAGNYYGIVHDCQSVSQMEHYFSMSGKAGTDEKAMSALVFYIPDDRSTTPKDSTDGNTYNIRNYDHQPQVGLYTIDLFAEVEPSDTYDVDSTYTITLDWRSSLEKMVNNDVNQTYIVYEVTFDSIGNRIYTPVDTVYNSTECQLTKPQTLASQTFTYVVMGFDFMTLYRQRYESDFIIHEEKNYYRNWLYPTNLAENTGMTMRQLKKEWPNQTASYTLWRDNLGVAKLEVKAIGKKVYYRIRYYNDTQVTTGVNDITMPNDKYLTMPNTND